MTRETNRKDVQRRREEGEGRREEEEEEEVEEVSGDTDEEKGGVNAHCWCTLHCALCTVHTRAAQRRSDGRRRSINNCHSHVNMMTISWIDNERHVGHRFDRLSINGGAGRKRERLMASGRVG